MFSYKNVGSSRQRVFTINQDIINYVLKCTHTSSSMEDDVTNPPSDVVLKDDDNESEDYYKY